VLDMGCASGLLAAEFRARGNVVVGVDRDPPAGAEDNVDRLIVSDLDAGLPAEAAAEGPFDVVLAVDVREHLRDPAPLLRELHRWSSPDAVLISSVPNIGHWYPRLRIGFGRFDSDRRGILDATHLRFFTWRSFAAIAARVGWRVEQRRLTGLPLEVLEFDEGAPGWRGLHTTLARIDRGGRAVWPSLFAYQYVAVLRATPPSRRFRSASRAGPLNASSSPHSTGRRRLPCSPTRTRNAPAPTGSARRRPNRDDAG
jgi:SAM-dependent methyltransferase